MSCFDLKFQNLKLKDQEFHNSFKKITLSITDLEQNFNNLIKKYKNKKPINGLDELYFQKCMILNEKNTLLNFYYLILNRIYGDYYKIFKLLNLYLKHNTIKYKNKQSITHRIYNNLNLTDSYSINEIENIYLEIIDILRILDNYIESEERDLKENIKNKNDMNINNFITTLQEDVNCNTNKISKFNDYINYLVYLHTDYFEKIEIKINLILNLYKIKEYQFKNEQNEIGLITSIDNKRAYVDENKINMKISRKNNNPLIKKKSYLENGIKIDNRLSESQSDFYQTDKFLEIEEKKINEDHVDDKIYLDDKEKLDNKLITENQFIVEDPMNKARVENHVLNNKNEEYTNNINNSNNKLDFLNTDDQGDKVITDVPVDVVNTDGHGDNVITDVPVDVVNTDGHGDNVITDAPVDVVNTDVPGDTVITNTP